MDADDPRHGENRGYNAGCRDTCCRTAHAQHRKNMRTRMYLARVNRLHTDATGTRRRIQALMALGWSTRELDKMLGRRPSYVYRVLTGEGDVYLTTANMIADLYDRLCMTRPRPATTEGAAIVRRNVNMAARRGYVPPLAWNNIDDPDEVPAATTDPHGRNRDDLDPVVVDRLVAGEHVESTRAERDEAMRRWRAAGRSERSLCELFGWHEGRYGRDAA
jgi:hypothetical protein